MGMLLYVIIALLIFAVGFAVVVYLFNIGESDDKDVPVDLHEHYSKPSKTKQQKPKYSGYDEVEDMPSLEASDLCGVVRSKAVKQQYTKQRNTDELYELGKNVLAPKILGAINKMVTENTNPVNTVWVEIFNDFNSSDDQNGQRVFKISMSGGYDCKELRWLNFPFYVNKLLLEDYNGMEVSEEYIDLLMTTNQTQPTGEFTNDGIEIYRHRELRMEELPETTRNLVLSVSPPHKGMMDKIHERGFDIKKEVYDSSYGSPAYRFKISWCNNVEDTNE